MDAHALGTPGTRSSLALRVTQCLSAAAAMATMCHAYSISFNNYQAYWYLNYSMLIQFVWSLTVGFADLYFLKNQAELHTGIVRAFLIGDWVVATLAFSAASASAGVTIFFEWDTPFCANWDELQLCSYYRIAVILAFITWSLQAASATAMFWLNAAL